MASVEQLIQKLRRGEKPHVVMTAKMDAELAEGIQRIRNRLSGKKATSPAPQAEPAAWKNILQNFFRSPQHMAVATILLILLAAIPLMRRQTPLSKPPEGWLIAGQALTSASNTPLPTGGKLELPEKITVEALANSIVRVAPPEKAVQQVYLLYGAAQITRHDASLPVTVHANGSLFHLRGTRFILHSAPGAITLMLLEGEIEYRDAQTQRSLTVAGENLLRVRAGKPEYAKAAFTDLAANFPELKETLRHFSIEAPKPSKKIAAMKNPPLASSRIGECVTYYRNNEKRRGKIHAHDGQGFVIYGSSGPEPGHFRDGDFFREPCNE